LIDAVLILLGIVALLTKKKTHRAGILIILSIVVFSIPNLINTMSQWHLPRTFLAYTMLLILISWGGWLVWQDKFWRWVVSGTYLIGIIYFSYQYFYCYPVTHLDAGTWDERIVATYAGFTQSKQEIWIYSDTPEMTFYNYLLYENLIVKENLAEIKNTVLFNQNQPIKHFTLDRITITNDCIDITLNRVHAWEVGHSFCRTQAEVLINKQELAKLDRLTIPAVLDSGEAYRIYDDIICQQYELAQFVHLQQINDLNLDEMNAQQFCQKWITDLREFN